MSQTDLVFQHLKRYGAITPFEALNEYGCMRLAPRVRELREAGHGIETVMVTRLRRGRMTRFAEYRYHAKRSAA